MRICDAAKKDGTPCTLPAQGESVFCWAHRPENAEARRKGASEGGRSKPGSELAQLKRKLITLGDDVLSGNVDKGKASVAAVCYGTAIKATEAEVKVRELEESRIVETNLRVQEQTELIARLEAIEEAQAAQVAEKPSMGGGRWGA